MELISKLSDILEKSEWALDKKKSILIIQILARMKLMVTAGGIKKKQLVTSRTELELWTGLTSHSVRIIINSHDFREIFAIKKCGKKTMISIAYTENEATSLTQNARKTHDKKQKKVKEAPERSILSDLFSPDDEIQKWLSTGSKTCQQELITSYAKEVLQKEIKKAYLWQLEKSKRSAGTFLISWLGRAYPTMPRGEIDADNPFNDPYLKKIKELEKKGEFNE